MFELDSDSKRLMYLDVAKFDVLYASKFATIKAAQAAANRLVTPAGVQWSEISEDVQALVLAVAVAKQGKTAVDVLTNELDINSDAAQRHMVLNALGHIGSAELTRDVLPLLLSDQLRKNEVPTLLRALTRTRRPESARSAVWVWVKDNYDALAERMIERRLGGLPLMFADYCGAAFFTDMSRFFSERTQHLIGGERNLRKAQNHMMVCLGLRDRLGRAANAHFPPL
ncbi:MAG: hypothetical protein HKM24_08115 [Gammaproteobacteria bacterium]|nr:hypothetical protein [Gammaproteobacteria bacterium]